MHPFFFIFRRAVRGGEEKRTLIKNSSHWRYETQFIHASPALNCKRLTAEWFATSVNLPKWGSSQIFATAHALNNSQYCTSVLFHFYLFSSLSTVGSPNHRYCTRRERCNSFSYRATLIRRRLLGIRANNKEEAWGKGTSLPFKFLLTWWQAGKVKHFTATDYPLCANGPL